MAKWIDVHAHLNMLEPDPKLLLDEALKTGVEKIITIATEPGDFDQVLKWVEAGTPYVYGTLGVHPHDSQKYDEACEKFLRAHLPDKRIVGVGEIGLDYYYNHSPHDVQQEVFRKQMSLAAEFGLPVEIHTRDAEQDTVTILKEFKGSVKGLLHCFTGTQYLADEALALGYNISLSGVLTFKNADALRAVAASVPLDRVHVETDCPFLAPVPHRGKKNAPSLIVHTAEKLAEIKQIDLEALAVQCWQNAHQLFPKLHA